MGTVAGGAQDGGHVSAHADNPPVPDVGHIMLTRLAPFAQQAQILERSQLMARLNDGLGASLILLRAPAGYGKTTLTAQWRRLLLDRGEMVAWVSLDEEDDTPALLVSYLACALYRAGVALPADLFTTLAATDSEAKLRLRRLMNAIAAVERRVVLILDEYERLHAAIAGMVLPLLLSHAPANLVTVIASREAPTMLPLATLRARGMMVELRPDDLHFSAHEVGALFDGALSRKDLMAVLEKTNGWPVALQLLRGWWTRQGLSPRDLASLDQATPHIAEYLSEQVLAALPAAQRTFLAEASVLDRLSVGALEQVVGTSDGWRQLLSADGLRPFIIPIDTDVGVYRLHPIFNEALALEFAALPVARQRKLRIAAARWYARAGQLARAVRMAVEAGELDLAGGIVEDAGAGLIWLRHGMSRSKAVNAALTDPLLERFPRLRLLRALILLKDGQISAARREFELARSITANFTYDPRGSATALRRDSLMVEATLLTNECRPANDSYFTAYEREMQAIAGDDHVLLAHVENFYCISCHQRGLFDKAAAAGHKAIDHNRQANLSHGEFYNCLHLGVISFGQGNAVTAQAFYDRAREMAQERFADETSKKFLIDALSAELAYELGSLGQAKTLVRRGMEQIRRSEIWHDIFAAEYVTAALLAAQQDGSEVALGILDAARTDAMERHASGMTPLLTATRIVCLLTGGRDDAAREAYQHADIVLQDYLALSGEMTWREREMVLTATVRLAARFPDMSLPLNGLRDALEQMWKARHVRTAIRLTVALCCYLRSRNLMAEAAALLPFLLRAVALNGYVQPLAEEGQRFLPFLKTAVDFGLLDPESRRHAVDLLERLQIPATTTGSAPRLTEREREVLRELGRGLSDKAIARELGLTENTVKYHLKNVYSKFRVKNRAEAVNKGFHYGYLS